MCCEEVEDMSDSVLITLLICATVLALALLPKKEMPPSKIERQGGYMPSRSACVPVRTAVRISASGVTS